MSARTEFSRRSRTPTIADLLESSTGPLFSFEFFPPKDDAQQRQLWQTVRHLEALGPDFVSVTYGASGSTRERTIRVTEDIARNTTLRTMAHLTCASQSRDQLRRVIGSYAAAGIRHVLAIRGDPPGGPRELWVPHPEGLDNATQLVSLVRELGDFCVGVAAFPDVHPEHGDPDLDARILVDKARAGASFAITQLFFGAQDYFDLVGRVRALGCDIPIIPGIMPVTSLPQISRFAELSGAALPATVTDRLHEVADDADQVRRVGIEIATELSETLLNGGAPGLHFFTQNRSLATREIYARLHQAPHRR
ncbi:methylenetetrahydrofolate reductase [NAD(P)H] [Microlunatus panaciterrae]|uniref:Methylenetetrahydrofolate reductase n=1 Tax=Microlunatus panaciterrae TaxID=400768 RepID=A0ABS2RNY0_9ACTN|nr:methylenetetrahydrofolate reductase [NAD(P)H] [Microlunatus panaciterrae]MBM7800182.1 methylenetetrahydrofolate reductase (NADPH) [Microlunatus panaciterrae]